MKCPYCRSPQTEVYNSRITRRDSQVWRRRRCLDCREPFTTYEAVDLNFLIITKKSGIRQRYSRAKLYSGIYGAFLSISQKEATVDAVTSTVEAAILDTKQRALSSEAVAAIVLSSLKQANLTAYLRFLAYHVNPATEADIERALKRFV